MMNESEKSDSAIVAVKPANKAGQPAAEWVEPRAGTKGNTGQPHTRRTQRRGSVSQGLDRVRNVARQRKKENKNPSSLAATAFCRQIPEVGAVCPNWARTDLCGGCPATGIPTAIDTRAHNFAAPLIQEFSRPGWRLVVPELLEVFLEEIGAYAFEVVAQHVTQLDAL